jgi:Glycosyl hydrolase family 98 C-terminal domain/Glycosyl hydrolase family 98/Bacterial Ig-like domain (group 4)
VSRRTPARHQHEHSARSAVGALRRRLAHLLTLILIGSALTAIAAVTSPHAAHAATLRRVVNASHPLLLLQLVAGANLSDDPDFRNDINKEGWDVAEAWSNIPDDIKPYVAFVLHPGHNSLWTTADAQAWMTANVAEAETLNVPVLALWGEQPTAGSGGLSYIQSLYEDYPNFIGTAISELTGDDSDIPSLLALANEYGGYHVQSSIESAGVLDTKMDNSTFYNEIQADAANFIYAPKNTHDNFDAVTGQAEGDWLSGVAGNWGPYFDGYAFYGCGIYGETSNGGGDRCSRSEPEEGWGQTMLDDYMAGATVYHFENQTDAPGFENQYTPSFWQSILPAFRYIIAHPAPSAAQVIANTKVAFSEAKGSIYSIDDSTFYGGLSENPTDALVEQGLWWYPRGSGQYYFIPVLPDLAPSSVVSEFPNVITAASYNSSLLGLNNKLAYFNKLYPKLYSGDAFVQNIGTQWLVYNTHYADDTAESADIPLTNGSQWSDIEFPSLNPNSMAMINDNATSLGIELDNYTTNRATDLLSVGGFRTMEFIDSYNEYAYTAHPNDTTLRTDVIRVRTTSEPTLTISGYDGHYTYSQEWNPNTHIYTLTVNHNGVVQINLDHGATDTAAEGWTRTDDGSSAVTYGGSWTAETGATGDYDGTYHVSTSAGATASYEFNGTSVEWLANTVAGGGTASVYIDGTLFASGVSLNSSSPADGAVVWRTTGLTNQPHTIKIVATGGDIGLDRFAYQPSQLWMINDIDEQNFSYGTAATAEGDLQGSDHWVITDGQMKILPYVAPWTSDVSVYNTNDTYTNSSGFTYSAKITSAKGTPGGLLFDASPTAKSGYYFFIDPTNSIGDTEVALVKIAGGDLDVLAEDSSASISLNTAYTMSVTVSGSSITGFLNGSKVLSATDSSDTSGETGVRVQDNVGGVGDFVYATDPTVTVGGATSYSSTFGSWSAASGWVTEGALVFKADWPTETSFDQPWNWARTGGTWTVVNNDAIETSGRNGIFQGVAGSSGTSTALAGSTSWEDYRYSSLLEFPPSGSSGTGGLIFRSKDANDYYELSVTRTSVSLVKDVAGTLTTLATTSRAFSLGDWYALAVTSDGDMLSATVNGVQVLATEDSTYRSGEVGYAAGAGHTVDFDDATIMQLPTAGTGSTPPAAVKVDPATTTTIAGYAPVIVKTPLGTAPALPATVTAYFENGTTGSVAVTWPTPTASQLATADTPQAAGASSGDFTLTGTVSGSSVSPTVEVEVQPVLDSTLSSSVTVTSGETDFLPLTYDDVRFNAGSLTYTRNVNIDWNTVPNTSTMTPGQSVTVQGTIEGYPYATATAKVTLS